MLRRSITTKAVGTSISLPFAHSLPPSSCFPFGSITSEAVYFLSSRVLGFQCGGEAEQGWSKPRSTLRGGSFGKGWYVR